VALDLTKAIGTLKFLLPLDPVSSYPKSFPEVKSLSSK